MSEQDFAPFFCNGLLCFPSSTVDLLMEAGLDAAYAQPALHGVRLDERGLIAELQCVLNTVVARLPATSAAYAALTSEDARFMLTGFPVESSAPFAARIAP